MLKIDPIGNIRTALDKALRDYATPHKTEMMRADYVIIPTLEWWSREWLPYWNRFRAKRNVKNWNGSFCESPAIKAVSEAIDIAGERAERTRQDATIGLFEARFYIRGQYFGNYRIKGGHSATLMAYAEQDQIRLAVWDPMAQPFNKPLLYENIEDIRNRVDFSDVLL